MISINAFPSFYVVGVVVDRLVQEKKFTKPVTYKMRRSFEGEDDLYAKMTSASHHMEIYCRIAGHSSRVHLNLSSQNAYDTVMD